MSEEEWIDVPYDRVPAETLRSLLEEACTRDGTEMTDASTKVAQLHAEVVAGRIKLRYYTAAECCQLVWA